MECVWEVTGVFFVFLNDREGFYGPGDLREHLGWALLGPPHLEMAWKHRVNGSTSEGPISFGPSLLLYGSSVKKYKKKQGLWDKKPPVAKRTGFPFGRRGESRCAKAFVPTNLMLRADIVRYQPKKTTIISDFMEHLQYWHSDHSAPGLLPHMKRRLWFTLQHSGWRDF